MKPLISFLLMDIRLLHRNRLFYVGFIAALLYIGVFFLLSGSRDDFNWLLVILLFNDPLVTGYLFTGVLWLYDNSQNTMSVIRVLPVRPEMYYLSKIIVLSIYALLLSLVMIIAMHGLRFNVLHLSAGVLISAFMLSSWGFLIVSSAGSFNLFLMYSVPLFIITAIPFLQFAGIGNDYIYACIPVWGGIGVVRASLEGVPLLQLVIYYIHGAACSAASWYLLVRKPEVIQP
ncbi:MAG: hypothetical protein AMXMBFR48_23170 [Ignavibacteriales bacterium]